MAVKIFIKQQKVRVILARRNKSLGWFATHIGVTRQHVSDMMERRSCPSHGLRDTIMRVLRLRNEDWDSVFDMELR